MGVSAPQVHAPWPVATLPCAGLSSLQLFRELQVAPRMLAAPATAGGQRWEHVLLLEPVLPARFQHPLGAERDTSTFGTGCITLHLRLSPAAVARWYLAVQPPR